MMLEQFVAVVRDWQARYTPEQVRACVASLSMDIVDGLSRGTAVDEALAMVAEAPMPPASKGSRPPAPPTPSQRARKLLRQQLRNGPRLGEQIEAAAEAAAIPAKVLLAATDALGVKSKRSEWWLPERQSDEMQVA